METSDTHQPRARDVRIARAARRRRGLWAAGVVLVLLTTARAALVDAHLGLGAGWVEGYVEVIESEVRFEGRRWSLEPLVRRVRVRATAEGPVVWETNLFAPFLFSRLVLRSARDGALASARPEPTLVPGMVRSWRHHRVRYRLRYAGLGRAVLTHFEPAEPGL
jgi:hypothetical protein